MQAIAFETGAENMRERPATFAGWLADQGVDLAISDSPDSSGIAPVVLRELRANRMHLQGPVGKGADVSPNAATSPDVSHAVFGAPRQALGGSEAW